jgi:hypothetical protein
MFTAALAAWHGRLIWPVHREAEDRRETPDAQADGVASGGLAVHARDTGHTAQVVRRRSEWAPRLLWQATQLSCAQRLLPGSASDLAALSDMRRRSQKSRCMAWLEFETLTARFRLPTPCITRTWAHADMTRVTLGKGRVRESRPPGSVRAKPNGRATRPRSQTRIRAKISQRIPQRITSRIDLTMPLCASILPLACKWPRFTAVPKGGANGGWTGRA